METTATRFAGSQLSLTASQGWLLVAARVFTRNVRADLDGDGTVRWSAPRLLRPGDLALLYEMGRPDAPRDPSGRMQVGWVLRAKTAARADATWKYTAEFEGVPLAHPLPLAEMRLVLGRSLNLRGVRHMALSTERWNALLDLVDQRNEGFAAALAGDPDSLFNDLPDGAGVDDLPFPEDGGRVWRSERWLQNAVTDLIEEEGWASWPGPVAGGFSHPTQHGYYVPEVNRYLDDLLLVGPRHLLVVEYEREAVGDPKHGVAQVAESRDALRELRRLRDWQINALVIAGVFSGSELELANHEGIECMQATSDSRHDVVLVDVGPPGPASERRAAQAARQFQALRARLARRAARR